MRVAPYKQARPTVSMRQKIASPDSGQTGPKRGKCITVELRLDCYALYWR